MFPINKGTNGDSVFSPLRRSAEFKMLAMWRPVMMTEVAVGVFRKEDVVRTVRILGQILAGSSLFLCWYPEVALSCFLAGSILYYLGVKYTAY